MLRIALVALGYLVIVFPLALVWHNSLFFDLYTGFGYFAGDPNVPVGFITIVIQGVALAIAFPFFRPSRNGYPRAFTFVALMGLFFWTSHVLALVAKHNTPNALQFIALETGYLVLQFGLFGMLLGAIDRARK